MPGALERFRGEVSEAVYEDVVSWRGHPELGLLLDHLESAWDADQFYNIFAEAVVARHLLQHGCALRFEVRTPAGRSCDFEVRDRGQRFFLHVKRINTERASEQNLTVSSRLRYLERIERPYVVSIRWHQGLNAAQMRRLVVSASSFITHARVGDELTVKDEGGRELGGCRIVAPWSGTHVTLAIGLPGGFVDEAPRMQKLLRRAYRQFMPKALNVVMIGSSEPEDADDFETALLGSHVERWDSPPPRGRRVAHGRAADGFWHQGQFPGSAAAVWFHLDPQGASLKSRLWTRPHGRLDDAARDVLWDLFENE